MIAREGWTRIAIFALLAFGVQFFAGTIWALPLWLLLLLVIEFFRDPDREIPQQPGAIVSPAHGRVVAIENVVDPYVERRALKISIFMNIFSVHSNRTPVDGVVVKKWYEKGQFLNASLDKASELNERSAVHFRTKDGWDVTSVQIAGLVARRILCYLKNGQEVERGERYGFIRFGSRVDLYLPEDTYVVAQLGRWVLSGTDIIGFLPVSER